MARTLAPVKTPGHAHIRARTRARTHGVTARARHHFTSHRHTHTASWIRGQREEATKWHSGDRTLSCDAEQTIVDGVPTWLQVH